MLSRAKQECDALYKCVDEVADDDSRGYDLGVWVLLLVEVPSASHAEELAIVTRSVQD